MVKKLLLLIGLLSLSAFAQVPVEGFEGTWITGQGPASWITVNNSGPANMWQQAPNTLATPSYMGNYAAYLPGETMTNGVVAEDWLITPQFTIPINGQLSFYSRLQTPGNDGTYKVMIGTDPTNTTSFTELQSWTAATLNPMLDAYELKTVGLPALAAGQQMYIAFVGMGNNAHGWLVDNVMIASACAAPANLAVTNLTFYSAVLSWTEGGSATAWEIEIVPAGMPATGAGTLSTANPYVITGLTPNTCYHFYARAVCGPDSTSNWTGPMVFCTPGAPATDFYINGTARIDANGDGICNSSDLTVPNMELGVAINGVAAGSVYTNANGEYNLYLPNDGIYTVTFTPVALPGFTAPAPVTATYTLSGSQMVAGPDFCLDAPAGIVNNLAVTLTPLSNAIPGFVSHYILSVYNMGYTVPAGASATFSYDTTRFTLTSLDGSSATGNGSLSVDIGALPVFGSETHTIALTAAVPPTNNSGDVAAFSAALTYADDNTADNTYALTQYFVNSYDPNDITVHQGAEITPEQADGYLTYTVRFQNTGTAPAATVRVEQALDANLDWDTFTPLAESHNAIVSRSGNALTYTFNNINLAYSDANEPASHGYITYRIKPKSTVAVGDFMYGTASIYFDFNEAIVTNTCSTQVVETLGTGGFAMANVKLYPNPVNNSLNISLANGALQTVQVYDLNGRLCLTSGSATEIDTHALSPGLYMVKVTTDSGTGNFKLIKE